MAATSLLPINHVYDGIYFNPLCFPCEHLKKVKEFEFFEDDVLVATYPKAGTTWMQEIVYLIMTDGNFEEAKKLTIRQRGAFLEMNSREEGYDGLATADSMKSPRQLKTHLQYKFFERSFQKQKPRVIIVMRNLKDNLVSYYYFYKAVCSFSFTGSFDDFIEMNKQSVLGYGDWFDFNLGWWKHKDDPRFLFVTYEDMKKNIKEVISKLCTFLGKQLNQEVVDAIIEHTSFEEMKHNKMVNFEFVPKVGINQEISPFMRKGIVGDWVNHFSAEQNQFYDELLKEKLAGTGLTFIYEG